MKYILILLALFSFNAFAQTPDSSDIISIKRDDVAWKIVKFNHGRFVSPDGEHVLVCLKKFTLNAEAGTCTNAKKENAWSDPREFKIPGYSFNKYEVLFYQAGVEYRTKRPIIKMTLLVHYKQNLSI